MIEVYKKKSEEERKEEKKLHFLRKEHGCYCDYCEKPNPHDNQLVVILSVWEEICQILRTKKDIRARYNTNIVLCPECMESLLGRDIKYDELGRTHGGEGVVIACNIPYMKKHPGYLNRFWREVKVEKRQGFNPCHREFLQQD